MSSAQTVLMRNIRRLLSVERCGGRPRPVMLVELNTYYGDGVRHLDDGICRPGESRLALSPSCASSLCARLPSHRRDAHQQLLRRAKAPASLALPPRRRNVARGQLVVAEASSRGSALAGPLSATTATFDLRQTRRVLLHTRRYSLLVDTSALGLAASQVSTRLVSPAWIPWLLSTPSDSFAHAATSA